MLALTTLVLYIFDDQQQVGGPRFIQLVNYYFQVLSQSQQKSWLLYSSDSGLFAVGLIAALLAGKRIVLPANAQSQTLDNILPQVDGVLSSELFEQEVTQVILSQDIGQSSAAVWPQSTEFGTLVLFTSGSRGEAKKIDKSIAQLSAEIITLEQTFGLETLNGCNQVLASVSHQHIYGLLFKVLWPLVVGRAFYTPLVEYPEYLNEWLQKNNKVIFVSSPAFLSRFA